MRIRSYIQAKNCKLKKLIDMSGCEHPGMIKPGMVDVSEFELIKCSVLSGFELTNYHVSSELDVMI